MKYEFHPAADVFPLLGEGLLEQLAEDIRQNGLIHPIVLHGGKILDGRNRYRACEIAGVEPKFIEYDGDKPIHFIVSSNVHRRHMTVTQLACAAVDILPHFEAAALERMREGGKKSAPGRPAEKGSADLRTLSPRVTKASDEAAEVFGISPRTVEDAKYVKKHSPDTFEDMREGKLSVHGAVTQLKKPTPHVSKNSGDNEWYTPKEIIEAAREVMGGIDLDPASSPEANEVVKATKFFTKEDDGLTREWFGRVWLNPPYAQPLISYFAEAVARCQHDEHIILVNNATETQWFVQMQQTSAGVCFPSGRIRFWKPDGTPGAPLQGQAILYCGSNLTAFCERFSDFGPTAIFWDSPWRELL